MKLSCNVARDLLPLYHDGVCSGESRGLVEAHVESCADCRRLLNELRGEIEIPHEEPDDLGAMKKLEAGVSRGKKRAWMKGVAAALAVVLVLAAGVVGWNAYENNRYRAICLKFAEGQTPIEDDGSAYSYPWDYDWVSGNYRFLITLPDEGNSQGAVEVFEYKRTKDISLPDDLVEVGMSIQFDEGKYCYLISIDDDAATLARCYEYVILDQNGQMVYDESWDAETTARKEELLETYQSEILAIITAAEREWPFLME